MLLKVEGTNESYVNFKVPFNKQKRLKICTFKVQLKGKGIAKEFLKIIDEEAKKIIFQKFTFAYLKNMMI